MIRPIIPSNPSQLSTPPRSTTFPAKSAEKHPVQHHPHRVHHHHHHHHHHHDKSVPQSAILPTTSNPFAEFLSKTNNRTDGRIDGNKTPPREPEQHEDDSERADGLKETEKGREQERKTWMEVERVKARRNNADSDLRTRLTALSTLSTTTTRRLDYTYYSLLSSISSLTAAVSSLASLSTQTSTLQTHFTSSSSSLTSEITTQISSSSNSFEAQACRISQLERRIKKGREKVERLGDRLEGVRERVDGSSLRDSESRRMTGRRLNIMWGSLGFFLGLFLILAATRQWRRTEDVVRDEVVHLGNRMEDGFEEVMGTSQDKWERASEEQRDDEGWMPSAKTAIKAQHTTVRSSAVDADATLRLFDEL